MIPPAPRPATLALRLLCFRFCFLPSSDLICLSPSLSFSPISHYPKIFFTPRQQPFPVPARINRCPAPLQRPLHLSSHTYPYLSACAPLCISLLAHCSPFRPASYISTLHIDPSVYEYYVAAPPPPPHLASNRNDETVKHRKITRVCRFNVRRRRLLTGLTLESRVGKCAKSYSIPNHCQRSGPRARAARHVGEWSI